MVVHCRSGSRWFNSAENRFMDFVTRPEVVRCYFDTTVQPHIAAMKLRWDPDAPGVGDRVWHLPDGVSVKGPAPEHFGVTIIAAGSIPTTCVYCGTSSAWPGTICRACKS